MKSKILFKLNLFFAGTCALLFIFTYSVFSKVAAQQEHYSAESRQCPLRVLGCVARWSHDAVGYHPAVYLMLENISGKDIAGEEIPFQSRFTELRDGNITVARDYKRTPVHNRERFNVLLRDPKSFELPIDSSLWPTIECKAMCRLVDKEGGDPQVYDLFVTHITRITLSDEDAYAQLITQAERNPMLNLHETLLAEEMEKGSLPPEIKVSTKIPKQLPKIGDDFYTFEQLFGRALEFQSSTTSSADDLTWAHYQAAAPLFDIYAGSRNASKVDALIVTLSSESIAKETQALSLAKVLAGCKKEEHIAPYAHSVHYSQGGRFEMMTTGIRDRRILSFRLPNSRNGKNNAANITAIFITRLAGDPEAALAAYQKRVNFIQF